MRDDLDRGKGIVDMVYLSKAANKTFHGKLVDKMTRYRMLLIRPFIGPPKGAQIGGSSLKGFSILV